MLNIVFGRENAPEGYVLDTRIYFKRHNKPEWFLDPFVQEFILAIDRDVHVMENVFRARNGKLITEDKLSTGCKTLCCIYFEEDRSKYFYGTALGKNCVPYMCRIACEKEVNLFVEHFLVIPQEYYERGIVHVNGKLVKDDDVYADLYADWLDTQIDHDMKTRGRIPGIEWPVDGGELVEDSYVSPEDVQEAMRILENADLSVFKED